MLKDNSAEHTEKNLHQWEKEKIDERLKAIALEPNRLKPIEELLEELKREI